MKDGVGRPLYPIVYDLGDELQNLAICFPICNHPVCANSQLTFLACFSESPEAATRIRRGDLY